MTTLVATLHRLVTEQQQQQQSDQFYGLFVYAGNVEHPPANAEPTLKLMQLEDAWIAFSDDRETDDCAACKPPFTQCGADVRFCHLRFPLSKQGTRQAVQTLVDLAEQPSTAFVVEYGIDDVQQQGDGMNARSIMRFPLRMGGGGSGEEEEAAGGDTNGGNKGRKTQAPQGKASHADANAPGGEGRGEGRGPTCTKAGGGYRMWLMGALVLLVVVSIVVAVVMYQRSKSGGGGGSAASGNGKAAPASKQEEQNQRDLNANRRRRRRGALLD